MERWERNTPQINNFKIELRQLLEKYNVKIHTNMDNDLVITGYEHIKCKDGKYRWWDTSIGTYKFDGGVEPINWCRGSWIVK